MSSSASSSDWRNVRVKEEPMSESEDGRRSAAPRVRGDRDRDRGGDYDYGRKVKRERRSPSPPPSHSKHRSSRPRSRSRSREKGRRDGDDGGARRVGGSRWERSRSRERQEAHRDREVDSRERRRPSSRDRAEHSRNRVDDGRPPKRERRSPSPRFRSPPPRQDRRNTNQGDGRRGRGGHSGGGRPRDGARESDWNNFFNPKSEMSQQANVKRERNDQDRKDALQEFDTNEEDSEKPVEKEQPNFGLSGKLTEEANTFRGVVIKYSEPPEARKPNKIKWRFYPFKGEEALPVMYVHRQSAYLIGRDRKIADIPVDHPSCSKQHAALQYRLVPYTRADGSKGRRIKPYIIDLESANGTFVNSKQIEAKRYVELFEKDMLKFGFSSREYVLLHDESKDIQDDSPELTPD